MSGPGKPGPDPLPREHGTVRGARQHVKYGEDVCPACSLARSAVDAVRYRAWRYAARVKATRIRKAAR